MDALVAKVAKAYQKPQTTHTTERLEPYRAKLQEEILGSDYVIPEVAELLASAMFDSYRTPTMELRVIGCRSPRDHWLCRRVCRRAATVQALFPTTPAALTVWVVLSNAKRAMPPHGGPIKPNHINGGYTYLRGSEIYVLRREEFPKVILHEVIHHTQHHTAHWTYDSLRKLYEAFQISQEQCAATSMETCSTVLEPNEAVVETWAEVLHMIFVSLDYELPLAPMYEAELRHAFSKTKKILAHQSAHQPIWRESTHAYSYIVVRTLLLCTFTSWAFSPTDPQVLTNHILKTWANPQIQAWIAAAPVDRSPSLRMTLLGDV